MKPVRTIGYQGATFTGVIDALRFAGVELLVDVRAVAGSRRPGFSKRQLAAGLAEAGIRYLHLRGLGTPKDGRLAARAGRHDELDRIYAAHLATDQAQAELGQLADLVAAGHDVCLLCFEQDHRHCHRAHVAAALTGRLGVPVQHLGAPPP